MNPLLSAPHRRDVIIGEPGNEWLIRLFGKERGPDASGAIRPGYDDVLRDVRYTIAAVVSREPDGHPVFVRQGAAAPRVLTFEASEAHVLATCSLRHDGITTVHVECVVDSKAMLWGLLAALEQARREAALEMGSAYMDRFEYGRETRRG